MVKGMIDALDDLGRFAHVDPATTDAKTVVEGVEMVERKLIKTLAGHGLEVIDPVDQPFDPVAPRGGDDRAGASAEEDHLVARVFQVGLRVQRPAAASRARRREAVERLTA